MSACTKTIKSQARGGRMPLLRRCIYDFLSSAVIKRWNCNLNKNPILLPINRPSPVHVSPKGFRKFNNFESTTTDRFSCDERMNYFLNFNCMHIIVTTFCVSNSRRQRKNNWRKLDLAFEKMTILLLKQTEKLQTQNLYYPLHSNFKSYQKLFWKKIIVSGNLKRDEYRHFLELQKITSINWQFCISSKIKISDTFSIYFEF